MAEDSIHQPNDKLLKATFSVPENARAFFQNHLPNELAEALDWNSLAIEPCSFIDPQLTSSESDLLFHITLHQSDAFLYLLFEHQSSEDPRMALRLLSYILRIWERFAQNHPSPAKLPAILPIVLAQGKRPWKTSTRLEDLIDLPPAVAHILRPWQPTLAYHLLELVRIPYNAFAGTPEGILTLRALKAEPMNELLDDAIWDESLLFSISEGALERILRYILNAEVSVTQLKERLGKIQTKPLQSKTMTLADQLRQEGEQEGIIKGSCGPSERQCCARWRSGTVRVRRESARPSSLSMTQHVWKHFMKLLFVLNHWNPSRKTFESDTDCSTPTKLSWGNAPAETRLRPV